ncbi:hypothetical protein DFQ14_102189 [Halopolyspora algeriensis]|uniref:Uncharacterized protein n=1 Tax=Halopolyspora algeriensis TaxID=1500506 RepID=A0A368W1L6_9ACTN|nr:hypothetical protein DFQ14_102189 [Halopolyspora algeriensis]TQM55302.1 hypothetical protein FHU43_0063 [Halopolyspora algeriensis]
MMKMSAGVLPEAIEHVLCQVETFASDWTSDIPTITDTPA